MSARRASPLLEEAAERSRVSMRTRLERVRLAWRSVVQCAVAAAIAWLIATELVGHSRPFFAPVAAIITLSTTISHRGRRAAELAIGVPLGIGIADVLLSAIGTGTAQLALVVALAYAAALLLGSGQLLANQAAVSAALVATLQPPSGGISFARALDALVGGAVALAVNALVFPADPERLLRDAAAPVLDELAATLDDIGAALAARDVPAAAAALTRARAIDEPHARFTDAVAMSRETTRYAPPRRGARSHVELYAEAAARIDLAVRNVRVLARGAIRAIRLDENVPPEVGDALAALAAAVRALAPVLDGGEGVDAVREPALRAAAEATAVLNRTGNLSVSVIVGQVRSTATDLLMGTGLRYEEAADAVRAAVRAADAASSG